eukprot:TRINITY_DN35973_c0_g1_i1.p1 TRINITY_DN35973_c0_g1~~TRINITY_DN35973_c0_g1_i1.p1  ORF type:complete len:493 (+),score=188.47 TRINITY_DN35973_c0_g1_i1:58-1479(+)
MSCPFQRAKVLASHTHVQLQGQASEGAAAAAPLPPKVQAPADFGSDPVSFLSAQQKQHPDAFFLQRGKMQYVVINDPQMVEAALGDEARFGDPVTANMSVNKNVFGVPAATLAAHETRVMKKLRGFLIRNKVPLANQIADHLKSYMGDKIGESKVMDLRDLGEAIFWPMTRALFGDHAVESVEPGLYDAWYKIDSLFGKALKGHVVPEVKDSVELARRNFLTAIEGQSGCPMGPVLRFYNGEVGAANGGDADAAARLSTAAWWGGLGNTWPSTVWTFGHILADPQCRAKAYKEVDEVFADQPDAKGNYDFEKLNFLTSCLNEVLRMKTYSVAWRTVKEDLTLESEAGRQWRFPRGTLVAVPWCVQHYDTKNWSEPHAFKPERYMPGTEELKGKGLSPVRERFAHSPFSWGPHKCSGYPLAMIEIPVALAVVFQMYDMELLDPLPGNDWKAAFGVVGPDEKPTRVRFTRRPTRQ